MIAYLGSMIDRQLAPATVRLAYQAIWAFLQSWHVQLQFPVDPLTVLDGYDRTSTYVSNKKDSILKSHIIKFVQSFDLEALSLVQLRDILAVSVMRMCFLRVSELAPSKRCPDKGIRLGDVHISNGNVGFSIDIRLRKNTREKSTYLIPSHVFGNIPVLKMVRAYSRYLPSLTEGAHVAQVPFFQAVNHDRLDGNPFNLASRMKFILTRMGIPESDHKLYGTHSFRVGATTEAAENGASLPQIQAAGGWRSPDTVKTYVRPTAKIASSIREALSR